MLLATLFGVAIASCLCYYFFIHRQSRSRSHSHAAAPTTVTAPGKKSKGAAKKKVDITAKYAAARKDSDVAASPHPSQDDRYVYRHLRGHQGEIRGLAVGRSARHVATVATDGQLRLWTISDDDKNVNSARINMPKGTCASAVDLSADDRYLCVAMEESKEVHIYGITEKGNQSFLTHLHSFPTPHKNPITTLRMAPNNSFIATMAKGQDLNLHLFSVKGVLIQTIPVGQLVNYQFAISSDSRYIATGTKIPDTKVFEVRYTKSDMKSSVASPTSTPTVSRVELLTTVKGHRRGVTSLAFGPPSHGTLVTASIDGSFAEHSLAVRLAMKEDPKLLSLTKTEHENGIECIDCTSDEGEGSNGEDDRTLIATAAGTTLQIWEGEQSDGTKPRLLHTNSHAHRGPITHLQFTRSGRRFLVTAGEGKTATIWRLPEPSQ